MDTDGFTEIADLALRKNGHSFRPAQRYVLEARLGDIIRREGFANLDGLAHCLKARPNRELEAEVVAALPAKQSSFFKDRGLLERIVHQVLPGIAEKSEAQRLRILCAGGGTGQEAYSLALLQSELERGQANRKPVDIVSVDLCRDATRKGRDGVFNHFEVQNGLSIFQLLDHFERQSDGSWQVNPDLRERIGFRVHNLMEDLTGLGEFDIILCRNVISTMARGVGRDVAERLARQLSPYGALFLGSEESIQMDNHYSLRLSRTIRGAYEAVRPGDDKASVAS